MRKSTYKRLSGSLRHVLRERDIIGHNGENTLHGLSEAIRSSVLIDPTLTLNDLAGVERLIEDNFNNGWDDALFRRCPPGGLDQISNQF